eukprot:CAMPEP_0172698002 /NCGR_PEP_ID=MMETSP1074-20121228/29147_1 /TAXON_ID=2916 /ORGANISM="Ceratium fusus, Strain PA161109" /LENGTH=41 /DNA_ID= /DNA_START= /DNA_END= /DNA_ORIENTATION=
MASLDVNDGAVEGRLKRVSDILVEGFVVVELPDNEAIHQTL